MISLSETEKVHKILIDTFGGTNGLRDLGGLKSALARPFQTFDNQELYPDALEKAAALVESILSNHPFGDGNHGYNIIATQKEKYEFVIKIASGNMKYDEIVKWLKFHTNMQAGA